MNQEKIGKFIAQCRKEKKLTQQELADKLGVSDRTVGNWENGRNMPDLSLFKPLCEEFNISMNDFLSGEKIKKEEYSKKSEENIVNTIIYTNKKVKQSERILSRVIFISGIIFLLLGAMFILVLMDNREKRKNIEDLEKNSNEIFEAVYSIGNNRHLNLTSFVPYCQNGNCTDLGVSLMNNELSLGDFISNLNYLSDIQDDGYMLYYYDKKKKVYGDENFYVAICNSKDNTNDIFIVQNKNTLVGKCILKYDDLEGVSMRIKEGTLTSTSATVIIRDTSNRDNIYGLYYRIEQKQNDEWVQLQYKPQEDGANVGFNLIGYQVDSVTHEKEFSINWERFYGELPKGEYRIVKDTSEPGEGTEHYITAEFIILANL